MERCNLYLPANVIPNGQCKDIIDTFFFVTLDLGNDNIINLNLRSVWPNIMCDVLLSWDC